MNELRELLAFDNSLSKLFPLDSEAEVNRITFEWFNETEFHVFAFQ